MVIREAVKEDVDVILALIKELAEYEKAPEQVSATREDIDRSLFTPSAVATCHLAEVDGEVVAIAIWFLNYSTWLGQSGIYLEDLYVQPNFRGRGIGKALMKTLAALCVERGYTRFQWWVLDRNIPAIDFYRSIGAEAMSDWTVFRLSGKALDSFSVSTD